uniref:DUF4905 domain-containing protein n=1 Tax=Chlorobium chlorochromatii (strain CaD3) TaxID=340177 RepID=Q3APR3_CHLCH
MSKQLALCWRYHAGNNALIWQIMFTESGLLVGQKRLVAEKKALFFALNETSGEVAVDDFVLMEHGEDSTIPAGEGWFTGIVTTRHALTYCYATAPESPEHLGMWAIDFREGKVVWSKAGASFVAHSKNAILAVATTFFAGFPERHFVLLEPTTGNEQPATLTIEQVNAIRAAAEPEEVRQGVMMPDLANELLLAAFPIITEHVGNKQLLCCELLTHGNWLIATLHYPSATPNCCDSYLAMWQGDTLRYHDYMEQAATRPLLNSVIVHNKHLFYIKAKNELCCLCLSTHHANHTDA